MAKMGNKKIKKTVKRKTAKRRNKPFYITLGIVIMIFFGSTFWNSQIYSLDEEIIAQEKQIEELKKNKMSLEGKIKGIKSSKEIQEEAMYKLGMVYPEQSQIVYVDISEDEVKKDVNDNVFLSPIISVLKSFTKN